MVTWRRDTSMNLSCDVSERIGLLRFGHATSQLLQQRFVYSLVRAFVARWHHTKPQTADNQSSIIGQSKRRATSVKGSQVKQHALSWQTDVEHAISCYQNATHNKAGIAHSSKQNDADRTDPFISKEKYFRTIGRIFIFSRVNRSEKLSLGLSSIFIHTK